MYKHIWFGILYHICWYTNDCPWIRKKNCVGLENIVRIEIDGRVNFKVRAAAAISKFSIFHLL